MRLASEPRPATVRSPWWEEIDAPPPRVTAPSLPVPASTPAPAEPVTAPLTLNAVPLVASSMIAKAAQVPETGPSSEAQSPATALLDVALAAAAHDGTALSSGAPDASPSFAEALQPLGSEALASEFQDDNASARGVSDGTLAPGELPAVASPPAALEQSIADADDLRSETPTVTLHVPFGLQDDLPTATATWPGLAPRPQEPSPAVSADSDADSAADAASAGAAPAERPLATIASEAATVEVPAVADAPEAEPISHVSSVGGGHGESLRRIDRARDATPEPIGVGLVSPAAGSHGSLADTWSRFLPTPSELRSVRLPTPDSPGKPTSPRSVVSAAGGDDDWASLSESDRDVAEFQSLFRARFGRTSTASVDGSLRLHRPVIAFERQLAARRQLERPSEGASALVSRLSERVVSGGASETRKAADIPPASGDTSFGSTGVRRGTVGNGAGEGLLPPTAAVKLRPFRMPTPAVIVAEPSIEASAPSAHPSAPVERPIVIGDDDIPDLPSDWTPRQ